MYCNGTLLCTVHVIVLQHVRTCASCQLDNVEHTKTRGLLQHLTIPTKKWQFVHIDWIVKFPPVVDQCRTYDQVLVFTDRASKMVNLISTWAKTTAFDTATMFVVNVVKYHGLPRSLISDRNKITISTIWIHVCAMLDCQS